jgi:hypothetical protein
VNATPVIRSLQQKQSISTVYLEGNVEEQRGQNNQSISKVHIVTIERMWSHSCDQNKKSVSKDD